MVTAAPGTVKAAMSTVFVPAARSTRVKPAMRGTLPPLKFSATEMGVALVSVSTPVPAPPEITSTRGAPSPPMLFSTSRLSVLFP